MCFLAREREEVKNVITTGYGQTNLHYIADSRSREAASRVKIKYDKRSQGEKEREPVQSSH